MQLYGFLQYQLVASAPDTVNQIFMDSHEEIEVMHSLYMTVNIKVIRRRQQGF